MTANGAEFETRCTAILRSVAFGWNQFEGKQTEQLVGKFEIMDGDDVGKFETWFGSLSEDENKKGRPFLEFTRDALKTCGWTGDDWTELPGLVQDGFLANAVSIVRKHRQDPETGKWRSQVKYVNSPGGANIDLKEKAMNPAEIAAFSKRMKARMSGRPSNGNGQAPIPPLGGRVGSQVLPPATHHRAQQGGGYGNAQRDVPPPSDDDIPF